MFTISCDSYDSAATAHDERKSQTFQQPDDITVMMALSTTNCVNGFSSSGAFSSKETVIPDHSLGH